MNHKRTICDQSRITQTAAPENGAPWPSRFNIAQVRRSSRGVSVSAVVSLAWIALSLLLPGQARGVQPKAETVRAFDQYVQKAELRMSEDLKQNQSFLWVDRLPSADRAAAYARLRNGGVLVHPFAAGLNIPGGMIHDWIGVVFIPNATLDETLAQIQNYNSYSQVYSPEVARSKIIERDGNDFKVSIWLQRNSLVTVVLDVVENVEYFRLDSSREYSRAHSIHIAEVKDPGTALEREDPSAKGHGYLWNLDAYGWFLQTPAGLYIQFEVIALSRDIPWSVEWLIKPLVTKVPRDSLTFTLAHARSSLEAVATSPAKVDEDGLSQRRAGEESAIDLNVPRATVVLADCSSKRPFHSVRSIAPNDGLRRLPMALPHM